MKFLRQFLFFKVKGGGGYSCKSEQNNWSPRTLSDLRIKTTNLLKKISTVTFECVCRKHCLVAHLQSIEPQLTDQKLDSCFKMNGEEKKNHHYFQVKCILIT